jgi:hypothetical protein
MERRKEYFALDPSFSYYIYILQLWVLCTNKKKERRKKGYVQWYRDVLPASSGVVRHIVVGYFLRLLEALSLRRAEPAIVFVKTKWEK